MALASKPRTSTIGTFAHAAPQQNGKVDRSDNEEFWDRRRLEDLDTAVAGARAWDRHYNQERFCLTFGGRTPTEKHPAPLPTAAA